MNDHLDPRPDPTGMTFLFSSFSPPPRRFFQGYAFIGADYVFGDGGAAAFEDATGAFISPGEDGCYVTIETDRSGLTSIGVDHAGLKKLFVYDVDGVWCVSNSLAQMAHHLRGHGRRLRADDAQLAGLRLTGAFTEQLAMPSTVFSDVGLLPRGDSIIIERGQLRRRRAKPDEHGPYAVALREFIDVWRSRLGTLIEDPRVAVSADLSGGLDSRVVYALASRASAAARLPEDVRLISGRSAPQRADLEAAQGIVERFGGTINGPATASSPSPLDPDTSYRAWRDLCLGVYLPIYFPKQAPSAWHANLSGLGGESHRPFYPELPPDEFAASLKQLPGADDADVWRSQVVALLEGWTEADPSASPLLRHYREFRGRIHGGLFAQSKVNITPLSSRLMDAVVRSSRSGRSTSFEVMEALLPGLMDLPFDAPGKAPTPEERRALLSIATATDVEPGRVFAPDDADVLRSRASAAPPDSAPSPIERLQDDFVRAATPATRAILGGRPVDEARDFLTAAGSTGSLGHARRASQVSRVLTVGFALDCDPSRALRD